LSTSTGRLGDLQPRRLRLVGAGADERREHHRRLGRLPAGARVPVSYASPLRARSFRNLPPATIILAEIDPLRSEGEAYGARLRQAGVPVTVTVYPGLTHEFFGMGAVVPRAKDAVGQAAAALGKS